MIADVLELLRCPHCGGALTASDTTVRCPNHHSFDVARQGYLNLLPGDAKTGSADTPAMVAAREAFFAAGHFDPVGDRVAEEAEAVIRGDGAIVELGAGTGWYLARVLERLPGRTGLALDVSKHALRRAARAHASIGAVVCDAWQPLPVRDGVAALALSVFAPRAAAELARILRPGGPLLVVSAAYDHLAELIAPLELIGIDPDKRERLEERLGPHFELERRDELRWQLRLDRAAARNAALMGPSAVHLDTAQLEARVAALPELATVTGSVEIAVFRKRAG